MNSSNYRFTLDLHSTQSQVSIPASVGDTSRTLYISLSDGGNPYFIEDGTLATLSIKRPTGTVIQEFCIIEGNANIKYPFTQNEKTCVVEGIHDCQVILTDEKGEQIAAPRFTMVVSDRVIDIDLSDEDESVLATMLAQEAERQTAETARIAAEKERVKASITKAEIDNDGDLVFTHGDGTTENLGQVAYKLTEEDETEIVNTVLSKLPYAEGLII